ncbi:hypothetical protein HAP48_0014865 [Bradyrhizobium septentrionale]|uniref:Uncharacterized protein n=1 Tax=Bradyrhizobium septentrionale TaxID=1404411 RepID=A0A973W9D3_9BRAD|nr:hypothetical protein [Bradyrhizobium septentrionale]UGY18611.1 hypothetical protein HAP48_0014865 [Bradyrhizobium septentrionale]
MKSNSKRLDDIQLISNRLLFSWRPVTVELSTVQSSIRAGQSVASRVGVAPAIADVIANLAGLKSEVR